MTALARLGDRLAPVAALVLLLWAVHTLNALFGGALAALGPVPRELSRLPGVAVAPLLHGSWAHLMANTVPLAVLGVLVAQQGPRRFAEVTLFVTFTAGLAVWLLARPAVHVGASLLVFGYFGYLLGRAWYERSVTALLIGGLALFAYGGLAWGLLPLSQGVSFESHIAGLAAGILAARGLEPAATRSSRHTRA